MTKQHYELRLALACYFTHDEITIPPVYFDHIVDAYNRKQMTGDVEQAAASTQFSALYDNVLELIDLLFPCHIALIWADNSIDDLNISRHLQVLIYIDELE